MDRAATHAELKDAINRAFPALSTQLRRIARFALDKPHDMALGTVASVAAATSVQPSAVIRFANALGFGGFSEMQQLFRDHLVERSASYRERIQQMRSERPDASKSRASVLHQMVGEAMGELGNLEENVRPASFNAAVRMICDAARIHVLAQRRAFPVAGYVAYALNQLELRTHLLDGAGGMLDASLRAIAPEDLLIVASFRNYSSEVVAAADTCRNRHVPVLAITDGPLSPLRPCASVVLDIGDESMHPFRSLVAPLCLAQALVVSTGHRIAERAARKPPRRRVVA